MPKYPVAIIKQQKVAYPLNPPFNPPSLFPETAIRTERDISNHVYFSVRELFRLLEYDKSNYNTENWNPLGWLINPGEMVFVKPNMITHKHIHNEDWDYVITHGSVIRAVVDFIYIALKGKGKIIIGDAPQTDSNYEKIIERMGLIEIQKLYKIKKGFEIELLDLRNEYWVSNDGIYVDKVNLRGDPYGNLKVDLASDSMFSEIDKLGRQFYGAYYDIEETNKHHTVGKHEYLAAKSPIIADVFIDIPKLKTHKKCGLTVNIKSLVGIATNKNWLPHYAFGSPKNGGDQFPKQNIKENLENLLVVNAKNEILNQNAFITFLTQKLRKAAYKVFKNTDEIIRSGNWYGNDTVWRMALDLNRILMFANANGVMGNSGKMKTFFSVVDGIISMEGNGPVAGTKKEIGLLIAGKNPVAVDTVCAKLMGFDLKKIPLLSRSFEKHKYPLIDGSFKDIIPKSNVQQWDKPLDVWQYNDLLHFKPHFGWIDNIEIENCL